MSAPFGYVVNDKYVNISVDTDTAFETDGDTNDAIITVEYSDAPAVGELTVEKKGEVLDEFKVHLPEQNSKFMLPRIFTQQTTRRMQTETALSITARGTL